MTSPALQEIIAVLSAPAAGNPAQYLLERALAAAGLDWRVITCDVPPERVAEAIAGTAAMGFRGCIVSGLLRGPALALTGAASPAARFAGGIGLLAPAADGLMGHMTDGRGVIEAVRSHVDPAGRGVLVLGAGLTGRATALELALAGAASTIVVDPDTARAAALVRDLEGIDAAAAGMLEWGETIVVPDGVAIVVRTTHAPTVLAGLRGEMLLAETAADAEPPREAVASGCCLVDGLEIRAVQAAIDFQSLTGLEADVEMLREALDEYLS